MGNLALIEERNKAEGPNGATHGWTKFIDLTPAEFKERYLKSTSGPKKDIEQVSLPTLGAGEGGPKRARQPVPPPDRAEADAVRLQLRDLAPQPEAEQVHERAHLSGRALPVVL